MPLPPPPPPTHISTWPTHEALLEDRVRALRAVRRGRLGGGRLAGLWGVGALAVLGWGLVTLPLKMIADEDAMVIVMGPVCGVLGLAALAGAVLILVFALRKDRRAGELARQWTELAPEPVTDREVRAPGASLIWLLVSFVPCALGLYTAFAGAYAARSAYEAVLTLGTGTLVWLTGLFGLARAFGHYQWVTHELGNSRTNSPVH
ncbi:hypothetical protein [Streptomyces indicus]|uniref:Uncharacterized protein n=1 Tax=Streptomyces indicus TaxID=417292 RepID=A0A1G9EED5_9ACTN|nr:hypothetical protein [Streptomyces indicus]SDK74395.1 hypothetical protein SAMN05421806_111109 [Streptomyces indicus]